MLPVFVGARQLVGCSAFWSVLSNFVGACLLVSSGWPVVARAMGWAALLRPVCGEVQCLTRCPMPACQAEQHATLLSHTSCSAAALQTRCLAPLPWKKCSCEPWEGQLASFGLVSGAPARVLCACRQFAWHAAPCQLATTPVDPPRLHSCGAVRGRAVAAGGGQGARAGGAGAPQLLRLPR